MSEKIKNLIKGIIVITVFAMSLVIVNRILMLKSQDGYAQMQSYYKQIDNTVDVLFLGSSKVYCQIDTGILWDEHGISSFDLGGAEAPAWNSYYHLKEALKTQSPKVIFYDASIIGYRHDVLYQPEVWVMTNSYGMHWNENRINLIKDNCESKEKFMSMIFPLGNMHSRYKELKKNDFIDNKNSINYKGFDYRNTIIEFEEPTVARDIYDMIPVNEKHEQYLRLIAEYAKEHDIPLIVMITPYVVTEEHQMYFNYIESVCNDMDVDYIDFNKMYDDIGINFKEDMAEDMHVNLSGSEKLTKYLGNYIKENYDVADHRGDPLYNSWEADAQTNRNIRIKEEQKRSEEQ